RGLRAPTAREVRERRRAPECCAWPFNGERRGQRPAVGTHAVRIPHRGAAQIQARRDALPPRCWRKAEKQQDAASDPASPNHDAPSLAGATRSTELSVPNSSDDASDAGSTTHRLPSTMKAYSWRPGDSGNDTDHTPGFGAARSGVLSGRHSLKSPTMETVRAVESTRTNRTNSTVSGRDATDAGTRVAATVDSAATMAIPAAIASIV